MLPEYDGEREELLGVLDEDENAIDGARDALGQDGGVDGSLQGEEVRGI
jgi:hypothetical protein